MQCVRSDLVLSLDAVDTVRMLEFWRWLIPDDHQPLFATALGDLFLKSPRGGICWLDVGNGEVEIVADSPEGFDRALLDPENVSFWFGATLVDDLIEGGQTLNAGQCYSYRVLPVLGGEYETENFRVYDLITHFRVHGPIHQEIKDLPDGPSVPLKIVE